MLLMHSLQLCAACPRIHSVQKSENSYLSPERVWHKVPRNARSDIESEECAIRHALPFNTASELLHNQHASIEAILAPNTLMTIMAERVTIDQLRHLRESEDRIEFKAAKGGTFSYNGAHKSSHQDRRKCILGYVVAFANAGGGRLVFGMTDKHPHEVCGTTLYKDGLGDLNSRIRKEIGVSTTIYELFEDETNKTGRVVVIEIPPRPLGHIFKFEDVPLTRVGEDLQAMSEQELRSILEEQEPDFSSKICEQATYADIDEEAVEILKRKYAAKQGNPSFLSLPTSQVLSDLKLTNNDKITFAALILVGKVDSLSRFLPQAKIILEYRKTESVPSYDHREEYTEPFFKMSDGLWHDINLRNGKIDVQDGLYIFNIPFFNESVIREAINNAVAHRDYHQMGEITICQYQAKMVIKNPGGFPYGVDVDNILRAPSTPRNRLLADILSKTGIVERSGQGVDKIFRITLSEGKEAPNYSYSDNFHVELHLSAKIADPAFAKFINAEQRELPEEERLSVFEVIALNNIREGNHKKEEAEYIKSLLDRGMIEKRGRTRGTHYVLSKEYYEFSGKAGEYTQRARWNDSQSLQMILAHFTSFPQAKMRDFEMMLKEHITRRQIRQIVKQLVDRGMLLQKGDGSGTYYEINPTFTEIQQAWITAMGIGVLLQQAVIVQNVSKNTHSNGLFQSTNRHDLTDN